MFSIEFFKNYRLHLYFLATDWFGYQQIVRSKLANDYLDVCPVHATLCGAKNTCFSWRWLTNDTNPFDEILMAINGTGHQLPICDIKEGF